jgi:hypothetical protein
MTINSNLFFKAVSVIAKQKPMASASSTRASPTVYVSLPTSTSSKGAKKAVTSKCFYLSQFSAQLQLNHLEPDPLEKFLSKSDSDLVSRARDVVANSVMAEIAKEDPQGTAEYQDAVRHQIVGIFQRLRLLLLVLDTLMEAYNASH